VPALALLLTVIAGNIMAQSRPPAPTDDTQLWNDIQITAPLNKKVDFLVTTTLRIGRDISFLVDRRVGVGFNIKAGKYLSFAPSYTNITMRPSEGRKVNENRLNFAATVSVPLGKFIISDRSLFERRIRQPLDSTRYRNRLQFGHPINLGKVKLGLIVSDEVFYDWSVDEWVRNRFLVGVSHAFNKQLTGELYYMRQNDGRSLPGDLHVIGTTIRVRP
jgi:hypothetical protein